MEKSSMLLTPPYEIKGKSRLTMGTTPSPIRIGISRRDDHKDTGHDIFPVGIMKYIGYAPHSGEEQEHDHSDYNAKQPAEAINQIGVYGVAIHVRIPDSAQSLARTSRQKKRHPR